MMREREIRTGRRLASKSQLIGGTCIRITQYWLGEVQSLVTMRDVTFNTNGWTWLRPNRSYKSAPPSAYILSILGGYVTKDQCKLENMEGAHFFQWNYYPTDTFLRNRNKRLIICFAFIFSPTLIHKQVEKNEFKYSTKFSHHSSNGNH